MNPPREKLRYEQQLTNNLRSPLLLQNVGVPCTFWGFFLLRLVLSCERPPFMALISVTIDNREEEWWRKLVGK